ncbi:MAG: molybdopterin-dependent oxidoreductase, partial [Vicinamibacteria bacterium]|nr:molybdopterin-dependent oxidoreductase [Vicinamibacteria bacterium]
MCGIVIRGEGGRITDIRGDADDPFSRGHVCPKAVALQDLHDDPDRVRRPRRRTASGWQEIPWDEALHEAAERLAAIQRAHGRHAVALYQGNPTVHNHGALLGGQWFARTLRSHNKYSATSVDQLPHMLAALLMFGRQLLLPVPDVDRTSFFLMLGANPLASNGSLMTAPGIERRLKDLRARGGRLVVVDPRRSETAAIADQHFAIRPGTDAWLLAALLNVVFAEKLERPGRLGDFTDGFEALAAAVAPFTPERAAAATGLDAAAIRALARDFAAAPSAVAYGRVGLCTQEFGGLAAWLVIALDVVTGNLDREGGMMFARPAADLIALGERLSLRGHFGKGRSRVRGLPEFGGEYPAAALAEEIDTPGPGQVRGLVTLAGNPVLSTPNGARLDRALAGLEFMVAIDPHVNETTRHAHLLLPPVSPLERSHYDLVFHALAVRNTAKWSPALFAPAPDARGDFEILHALARGLDAAHGRLGLGGRAVHAAFGWLGADGLVDLLLRFGPHRLSRKRLARAPHGVDLGPLTPRLPAVLATPGRRVQLAPAPFLVDLERRSASAARELPALTLIGRRDLRSNNSWMHNSERLVKGRERCTLLMHPADAQA